MSADHYEDTRLPDDGIAPTPKANRIGGSFGMQFATNQFTTSVRIDGTRHKIRIARNELDTGWDATCTCGDGGVAVPWVITSSYDNGPMGNVGRRESFRAACAEAWNHLSGEIYYSITGD